MSVHTRASLAHDLFFPLALFGAIGGMTWAVRGSSGFGAAAGCIFAGVMLGTAWWYIARDPSPTQSRRYASGWIILAMTVAFGIAGTRGWMQWPHFFNEKMYTNYQNNEFEPISRSYGFAWMFIAGIPWAGLGACMVAWCASGRRTTPLQWVIRLAMGFGAAYLLSVVIYRAFPQVFLPFYNTMYDQYHNLESYPNLKKLVRDNREAMIQMGLYLGFLLFEVFRRDWKNVLLILTVGVLNGIAWSLLQNWMWAEQLWPDARFNFWRCWETSGGVTIGLSYGVAYFLVNRRMSETEIAEHAKQRTTGPTTLGWFAAYIVYALTLCWLMLEVMPLWSSLAFTVVALWFGGRYYRIGARESQNEASPWPVNGPILERWGAYTGLILGLGLSIKNGLKGWANIYLGNEGLWNDRFWLMAFPVMFILAIIVAMILLRRRPSQGLDTNVFPHAYALLWLVLIVQNVIAQLITGPFASWPEVAFKLYYALLFVISAVVVHHYYLFKKYEFERS